MRLADGRAAEALSLLEEAFPMWAGLREDAVGDRRLAVLMGEPRFQALFRKPEG